MKELVKTRTPTVEVDGCGWRGEGEAETAPTGCMNMTDDVDRKINKYTWYD